jgi:peptidoglycan/xylan/chitin deacetylase (PgdA/CDA1 family)
MKFNTLTLTFFFILSLSVFSQQASYQNVTCNNVQILLTFDDGPHPTYTQEIVQILNNHKIQGLFFLSANKLDNKKSNENLIKIVRSMAKDGHKIGSHGYNHHPYDYRITPTGGLDTKMIPYENQENEIHKAENNIINALNANKIDNLGDLTHSFYFNYIKDNSRRKLFRFPYGRGAMPSNAELEYFKEKNIYQIDDGSNASKMYQYRKQSFALKLLHELNYFHLGWNNDVYDDKAEYQISVYDQNVIDHYIEKNYQSLCKKYQNITKTHKIVALFHDIKLINPLALNDLINRLKDSGVTFIRPELDNLPVLH